MKGMFGKDLKYSCNPHSLKEGTETLHRYKLMRSLFGVQSPMGSKKID